MSFVKDFRDITEDSFNTTLKSRAENRADFDKTKSKIEKPIKTFASGLNFGKRKKVKKSFKSEGLKL